MQHENVSLSQRIALFGSTLLVAFIIALGGAAWLIIREDQTRAHEQLVQQELEGEASRVGSLLATLHGHIGDLGDDQEQQRQAHSPAIASDQLPDIADQLRRFVSR